MNKEIQKRKKLRIQYYDYSQVGLYFVTICVQNRKNLLSKIIYDEDLNCAYTQLYPVGRISEKYINNINNEYTNIRINNYVIMPNHIHMIIEIIAENNCIQLSSLVSTFKRFTNKEYNKKIWQRNYYEHIIRNENEYLEILKYIENNPLNWEKDKYF